MPLGTQLGEGWAECYDVAGSFVADGAGALVDGVMRVSKRPILGGPQLDQAAQGYGYELALPGYVGVHEYYVVDGSERSYFVAGGFVVVLENGGNGLLAGNDGHWILL